MKAVVEQWMDNKSEEELNEDVVRKEIRKLENKLERFNVSPVGHMDEEKEEGRCRILYSQMNNASTRQVREVKMEIVERLNKSYQVDMDLFAELANHWG